MAEEEKKKNSKKKVPTAKKRDIQNKKRRLLNKSFKSKTKTAISSFLKSPKEQKKDILKTVFSLMDKGAKKGTFKKNKANRIKSKLHILLNKE